jgi:large subunit ribosomal protein L25
MSQQIEISAELREDVGKGASRRLRRAANKVPGILYGGEDDPVALTMKYNELAKAMESETFYSQILNVVVGGKAQQAVLRDLQRNPADDKVMHVDFLRISANKPIQVHVPLHFINEDKCVGVRQEGGNISHNMIEVEISSLPKDLPEYIEIDMESVELNQVIHLSDLSLPEGVTIVALMHGDERDANVVSVQQPRGGGEEEELEAAAAAEAEAGEGTGEAGSDEDASEG